MMFYTLSLRFQGHTGSSDETCLDFLTLPCQTELIKIDVVVRQQVSGAFTYRSPQKNKTQAALEKRKFTERKWKNEVFFVLWPFNIKQQGVHLLSTSLFVFLWRKRKPLGTQTDPLRGFYLLLSQRWAPLLSHLLCQNVQITVNGYKLNFWLQVSGNFQWILPDMMQIKSLGSDGCLAKTSLTFFVFYEVFSLAWWTLMLN